MDLNEGKAILFNVVVKGKKSYHRYYDRVNELAKLYKQLITGKDIKELMRRFTKREDAVMFKQRCEITQHIVMAVCKNLMDVKKKVPRANNIKRILAYEEDAEHTRAKEMEAILSKFWGNRSFDEYMKVREMELDDTDPNSFVVIEFKEFDENEEKAAPYPFEVSSMEAVDYVFDNNILQYLIVKNDIEVQAKKELKKGSKYTMYMPDHWIRLTRIFDERIIALLKDVNVVYDVGGLQYIKFDSKSERDQSYLYEEGEYNIGHVPAFRTGNKRDLWTNGETRINSFHEAVPYLLKSIKTNSELDLTMALIAFPQMLRYVKKCTNEDCYQGVVGDKNETCPVCHGEGVKIPTSSQDAVLIEMPNNPEEIVDLDRLLIYKAPPVDVVKMQQEYIDALTMKCKQVVFNTGIFDRKEIAETATGKNIDLQNVYDSLYSFAQKYSRVWKFGVDTIAIITEMDEGLRAAFIFGKDFKMKTLEDLIYDLKQAHDSDASSFIKQNIEDDIANIIFSDDPVNMRKFNVKKSLHPFSGMTDEEIQVNMAAGRITEFDQVYYANFSNIFNAIELDMANGIIKVDFYAMTRNKQWEIIEKKVNEIIEELEKEKPASPEIEIVEGVK